MNRRNIERHQIDERGVVRKSCLRCGIKKTLNKFYKNRRSSDGLYAHCNSCHNKAVRKYLSKPGILNKHALLCSTGRLKRLYGITSEEYHLLLNRQLGVCAICEREETRKVMGKLTNLAIDHNHKTGEVRGLICSRCNIGLGNFSDDANLLRRATNYLEGKND